MRIQKYSSQNGIFLSLCTILQYISFTILYVQQDCTEIKRTNNISTDSGSYKVSDTMNNEWWKRPMLGVDVIYLDMQKAFEKVPYIMLLTKLSGCGIHGRLPDWVKDFLSYRTQYVNVGSKYSEEVAVMSGIPKGSVLGPTLFIYFIYDMPEIVNCFIKISADDTITKVYTAVQPEEHCRLMQNSIDQLVQWQLKFNNDKCKISHDGKTIQSLHILRMTGSFSVQR